MPRGEESKQRGQARAKNPITLSPEEAKALVAEAIRRGQAAGKAVNRYEPQTHRFIEELHPKQRAFFDSKHKRKAALTSRQAGKTRGIIAEGTAACIDYPGSIVPYIALTRRSAKFILWPDLQAFSLKYSLGMEFNHSDMVAKFPNGSQFMVTGCASEEDIDKLRGPRYPKVFLDEAAFAMPHIRQLVEEVLDPATIAYDGSIVMASTPSPACEGYFFDVTTGREPGWETHKWTVLDNPGIPHAKDWLERKCKNSGWDRSHPIFRREWLGEWVASGDDLVYRFDRDRNVFEGELPKEVEKWHYGLGVDLGFDDPTAFVLGAYSYQHPYFFVVDVRRKSKMLPSEIAEVIRSYMEVWGLGYIMIDQAGPGKAIAEEFRQRWQIPCKAADKQKKKAYIEIVNGDLARGFVKVASSCDPLIDELTRIRWDPDKPGVEDNRFPNDVADAFLYCYREARHYLHEDAEEKIPTDESGKNKYFEKMMLEHALKKAKGTDDWFAP